MQPNYLLPKIQSKPELNLNLRPDERLASKPTDSHHLQNTRGKRSLANQVKRNITVQFWPRLNFLWLDNTISLPSTLRTKSPSICENFRGSRDRNQIGRFILFLTALFGVLFLHKEHLNTILNTFERLFACFIPQTQCSKHNPSQLYRGHMKL